MLGMSLRQLCDLHNRLKFEEKKGRGLWQFFNLFFWSHFIHFIFLRLFNKILNFKGASVANAYIMVFPRYRVLFLVCASPPLWRLVNSHKSALYGPEPGTKSAICIVYRVFRYLFVRCLSRSVCPGGGLGVRG
jgi:hypothetical protein